MKITIEGDPKLIGKILAELPEGVEERDLKSIEFVIQAMRLKAEQFSVDYGPSRTVTA